MQTDEFLAGLERLEKLAATKPTAIMCAEAVPWRCHRSLIADAVMAQGGAVEDIFVESDGASSRRVRTMTEFARVEGGRVWYPGEGELFG